MEVRQVNAGNGWNWIVDGYNLFRQSPVIWITLIFIYVLIAMVLSIIPVFGPIVLNLLAPVFIAGFMMGCKAIGEGDELEINHLFAGFKLHTSRLITVGGIYLAGIILIVGIVFVVTGSAELIGEHAAAQNAHNELSAAESGKVLLTLLIALAAILPLTMAYWFAPALVVFHDLLPVEALKLSFRACLRNIMPFLVYSLIILVMMMPLAVLAQVMGSLAIIPLGLTLLVVIPTMTASLYASYKDIFNPPPIAGGEIAL